MGKERNTRREMLAAVVVGEITLGLCIGAKSHWQTSPLAKTRQARLVEMSSL
jgi:hypothetical protein